VITAAVLFDLDDTLFDHRGCTRAALGALQARHAPFRGWTFDAFDAAHRALLEALHLEVLAGRLTVDEARLLRFRRLFEQAGEPAPDALARETAAEYREVYVANWQPVAGARELLAALHARVATGIVTNNVAAEQYQKIEACGFGKYVDAIVISEEAGVAKPDPRIFHLALARLGRTPQAAVMVGDAWSTDIAGAQAAGVRPIWFNRFGAASPDSTVQEIDSLAPADAVAARVLQPESPIPNPQSP
jgi:HAD superfamily hydrolase (TIGR01509 family)